MKKTMAMILTTIFASSLAFAQEVASETEEEEEAEERVCINSRSVRTFDAIDDEHIYVREGSSEHFLLTMQNRCFNLRNSLGIAFKDTTSRICDDGFGEIVYRDRMGSGRRLETCRIDEIERVDSKEDAEAIVKAREKSDEN